jgi:hypothetical protein
MTMQGAILEETKSTVRGTGELRDRMLRDLESYLSHALGDRGGCEHYSGRWQKNRAPCPPSPMHTMAPIEPPAASVGMAPDSPDFSACVPPGETDIRLRG